MGGGDVVAANVRVEEADSDTVGIKDGRDSGDTRENVLEVLDALTVFLVLDRAGIVNVKDPVKQRCLDQVNGDLGVELPLDSEGVQLTAGSVTPCKVTELVGVVKVANVLLLSVAPGTLTHVGDTLGELATELDFVGQQHPGG